MPGSRFPPRVPKASKGITTRRGVLQSSLGILQRVQPQVARGKQRTRQHENLHLTRHPSPAAPHAAACRRMPASRRSDWARTWAVCSGYFSSQAGSSGSAAQPRSVWQHSLQRVPAPRSAAALPRQGSSERVASWEVSQCPWPLLPAWPPQSCFGPDAPLISPESTEHWVSKLRWTIHLSSDGAKSADSAALPWPGHAALPWALGCNTSLGFSHE